MTLLMGATAKCGHTVTIEEDDDLPDDDRAQLVAEAKESLCPDCDRLEKLRHEMVQVLQQWIEVSTETPLANLFYGAKIHPYRAGGVYNGMYALELHDGRMFRFKLEEMPVFHLA